MKSGETADVDENSPALIDFSSSRGSFLRSLSRSFLVGEEIRIRKIGFTSAWTPRRELKEGGNGTSSLVSLSILSLPASRTPRWRTRRQSMKTEPVNSSAVTTMEVFFRARMALLVERIQEISFFMQINGRNNKIGAKWFSLNSNSNLTLDRINEMIELKWCVCWKYLIIINTQRILEVVQLKASSTRNRIFERNLSPHFSRWIDN